MDYKIIVGNSIGDIETGVKKAIKANWIPQGGMMACNIINKPAFYQAMIKK